MATKEIKTPLHFKGTLWCFVIETPINIFKTIYSFLIHLLINVEVSKPTFLNDFYWSYTC